MYVNRKSDRIIVEFGEGENKVTGFFVPLTVATKAMLSAKVAPFVKYAGKDANSLMSNFMNENGTLNLDTPEKQAEFGKLLEAKSDIEVFTRETVRETLREIKGLKDNDGNEYLVTLDVDGKPSDVCLDELFSCDELMSGLVRVGSMILHGVPKEGHVLDPATGEPVPGIFVKKSLKAMPRS